MAKIDKFGWGFSYVFDISHFILYNIDNFITDILEQIILFFVILELQMIYKLENIKSNEYNNRLMLNSKSWTIVREITINI